jgi:hypothetical protein
MAFTMAMRLGAWRAVCDFLLGLVLNQGTVGVDGEVGLQICCLGETSKTKEKNTTWLLLSRRQQSYN